MDEPTGKAPEGRVFLEGLSGLLDLSRASRAGDDRRRASPRSPRHTTVVRAFEGLVRHDHGQKDHRSRGWVAMNLDVLFEDNHCLAINKPAGLLSQGDASGDPSLV